MKRLYKSVIAASVFSVLAAATASAGPVEERKELMKTVVNPDCPDDLLI